jgi:hypothetical protein
MANSWVVEEKSRQAEWVTRMQEDRRIAESLSAKVQEAIDRTERLISLVPKDSMRWRPEIPAGGTEAIDIGHLLGHLLECISGFCACFARAFPLELTEAASLRSLEVNHFCEASTALRQLSQYRDFIDRGFSLCSNEDLKRLIPTVFVPEGETLMTLLLGNLEHLLNHKYQLFFYLKLLGVTVGSADLYEFRGV